MWQFTIDLADWAVRFFDKFLKTFAYLPENVS